ncbi:MAG: hypothetical protein LAP87_14625 [Acidobacteriia bacterium]|nr:hypothetical protein [Terriglobia bacterium]
MPVPQDVSIFLNNALTPTHNLAEVECGAGLPEAIRDMPEEVSGRFVALDPSLVHDIEAAWKRIMILNATRVLYTFTYDSQTGGFTAHKR